MNRISLKNHRIDRPSAMHLAVTYGAAGKGAANAFRASKIARLTSALIPTLLLLVFSTSATALETALEIRDKGLLEQPVYQQTTSPAEAREQLEELRNSVRKESKRLKKLSEKELKKAAKDGDRLAQLVLAETYAYEAHNNALTIGAANAAMGDALYWYSIAARKGYPGVPAIDKVMPLFPVRVVKGP